MQTDQYYLSSISDIIEDIEFFSNEIQEKNIKNFENSEILIMLLLKINRIQQISNTIENTILNIIQQI